MRRGTKATPGWGSVTGIDAVPSTRYIIEAVDIDVRMSWELRPAARVQSRMCRAFYEPP